MNEEYIMSMTMKELTSYCYENERLAQGQPWRGGKYQRAYNEFRKTIPMVKKFHEVYMSGVWDKEFKKKAHHMTWNELFSK